MRRTISLFWQKLPVVIRSLVEGLLVQILGIFPVFYLLMVNATTANAYPWAVIPGLIYLWFFWYYAKGRGWPASNSEARFARVRAKAVDPEIRVKVYLAGLFFSLAIAASVLLTWMLVEWPPEVAAQYDTFFKLPLLTAIPLLIMGALATGVVEESAYRGYMQYPVEQRHGPMAGIIFAALIFTLSHPLPTAVLPIFLFFSLGWGILAFVSNSLYPGILFHTLVDAGFFIWALFHQEIMSSILGMNVLKEGGAPFFWIILALCLVFTTIAGILLFHLYQRKRMEIKVPESSLQTSSA